MPNAEKPDVFSVPQVRIAPDGALLVGGRPVRTPILMNEYAVTAEFDGATRVSSSSLFELWQPVGLPRLRLLMGGRFFDGWLANSGYARVWNAPGTLRLRLALPEGVPATKLVFRAPGVRRAVVVRGGSSRIVSFAVGGGRWTLRWKAPLSYLPDGRPVSVRADAVSLEAVPTCIQGERPGADI
jgi:hypothetical protein